MGDMADDSENDAPLETDPTGRYQRCDEVLGEGAYKLVYRACDLEEGNEVAWNQLRFDHLSRREAQRSSPRLRSCSPSATTTSSTFMPPGPRRRPRSRAGSASSLSLNS
ncbi:unnamed protein product [Mortierella alpina]